ncbi:MAG: hypothetical protein KKH72_12195, partial [Alphaproteobacteria bacterium]|nr:hypothetical protein [Alphaproteobacteria bacterium]
MTSPWLNSDSERQAAALLADDRPAWIWASEDERLVWRNRAALAYEASHRRAAGERLVPVARQIPRAIRLGVPNRPSRARLQFTLGRKPISETCTCTPLLIEGGPPALLVVMADKVSDAEMALIAFDADSLRPFAGGAAHFVLTGADGSVLASGGDGRARLTARQKPALELPAGAGQSRFAIFPEAAAEAEIPPVPAPAAPPIEALVPDETAMVLQQAAARTAGGTQVAQAASDTEDGGSKLSSLLDRLDSSQVLYQPLDDSDDGILAPPQADAPQADAVVEPQGKRIPEPELASPPLTAAAAAEMGAPTEPRPVAPAASERRDDGNTDEAETGGGEDSVPVRLWRVIGRGFTPRGGESVSTEGFGTTRNRDTSFAAHAGDDGQQAGPFGDSHERTFRK